MKFYSTSYKFAAICEVVDQGKSISEVASNYSISRQTLSLWIRRLKQSSRSSETREKTFASVAVLQNRYVRGKNHPKSLPWSFEKKILELAIASPDLSMRKMVRKLADEGIRVSIFGIYTVLARHNLGSADLRRKFSVVCPGGTVMAKRIKPQDRVKAIRDCLESGKSIGEVSLKWHVSRPTLYKWIARYRKAEKRQKNKVYKEDKVATIIEALLPKYKRGHEHHRSIGSEVREIILDIVRTNPALSVHRIYAQIPKVGNKPIATHTAIQNLLFREGLNRYESRFEFAKGYTGSEPVKTAPLYQPDIQPWRWRMLFAPFKTVPKLAWLFTRGQIFLLLILFLGFYFYKIIWSVVTSPTGTSVGTFFASLSLTFGILFFVYSVKYYLSTFLVLRLTQAGQNRGLLSTNLEMVKLEGREPFVSIHVAAYNEKRVIERLVRACLFQKWSNYELVIADDSTDETTEITKTLMSADGRQLIRAEYDDEHEIFISTKPNGPTVKLIHRFSRSGFKGGALQKALENTDPKAQYICVFDADFVPYPDTVEQFVKTFQVLTVGSSESVVGSNNKENESTNYKLPTTNNIAAVQGYQWHVLNKSQTWITRGVRTEYAGSYVIERSADEIYQGLKQIAGSVYMIRADILRQFGWGTSITEDFELTLRLYAGGYKVAFTPYVQAPAEAVSTVKKLIRQRMRWAEGASFNIKNMFWPILRSEKLSGVEKMEFTYLAPYYLQAAFFVVGTLSWFMAETVLGSRLPFWTAALGWSLVFANMLSLPLMNIVGMFLEESDEQDYIGILVFIALSYIMVPFQAYASVRGFLEKEEGPWFRTPKTGVITDTFGRSGFRKFFGQAFGGRRGSSLQTTDYRLPTRLAFNPVRAENFRVRPRHLRYVGNLVLVAVVAVTVLISIFAPLIPQANLNTWASERQFGTLADRVEADDPRLRQGYGGQAVSLGETSREIKEPAILQFAAEEGKSLEYIFHQEPRVRTKFDKREIEFKVIGSEALGDALAKKSIKENGQYIYEEIFENVDLRLTPSLNKLIEEFILKERMELEDIEYTIKTVGLEVALHDNEVFFAPEEGGLPLFTFTKPFMYEQENPDQENFGIEYRLEKQTFGWKLEKRLTEEGRRWLLDPRRKFPVVIDPTQTTSTIQAAISTAESDYGQQQSKIVWANGALNGDAWYAVYEDASQILYEKCVPSVDGCETGTDWTDQTDIDGVTSNVYNPSVWWESDRAKMWVVWASNAADNLAFVDIDVDASDPGTAGNICTGADQANHNPTTWQVTITVDSSDTIYVSYVDTSTSTVNNMYSIATGGCTFTAILTGSGVDASDRPILLATGTQTLHAIFQDGTTLRHSVYVNDGTPGWDSADTDITGAAADNTTTNYSAATDGTDIWLIADQGTSGVDLWTCAACAASSSWTDAADPWSSQGTDIGEVSLTYSSETDDIIAFALRGSGSTEEVIVESTDSTTVSWGTESSLGVFGGGASGLEDLSATMSTNADDKSAFVVEDATNSELEFSTVPENILFLLILSPFLPKLLRKVRKARGL